MEFACSCVSVGFLWVVSFLTTAKKHALLTTRDSKLPLGVSMRLNGVTGDLSRVYTLPLSYVSWGHVPRDVTPL